MRCIIQQRTIIVDIVDSFQTELKRINPTVVNIQYKVSDIFKYIDSFNEYNMLWYTL